MTILNFQLILKCLMLSLLLLINLHCINGSSDSPHPHKGISKPFDNSLIKYSLTSSEEALLAQGKGVAKTTKNTNGEKGGRGFAVQDVHAPISTTLATIADLLSYPKYVPSVKKVNIYNGPTKFMNGTSKNKAQFDVRVFGVSFRYFLDLTLDTKRNTYTWTLDYDKTSDFDDNVGHWQVQKHPSKPQWCRVMYTADVRLPSWIPSMVVNFLTKTAVMESTQWVKQVSEKAALEENEAKKSSQGVGGFGWGRGGMASTTNGPIANLKKMNENIQKRMNDGNNNNNNNNGVEIFLEPDSPIHDNSNYSYLGFVKRIVYAPFRSSRD